MTVDKRKLITHLTSRQQFYRHSLIIVAVLGGLITAIVRGDFDTENNK